MKEMRTIAPNKKINRSLRYVSIKVFTCVTIATALLLCKAAETCWSREATRFMFRCKYKNSFTQLLKKSNLLPVLYRAFEVSTTIRIK